MRIVTTMKNTLPKKLEQFGRRMLEQINMGQGLTELLNSVYAAAPRHRLPYNRIAAWPCSRIREAVAADFCPVPIGDVMLRLLSPLRAFSVRRSRPLPCNGTRREFSMDLAIVTLARKTESGSPPLIHREGMRSSYSRCAFIDAENHRCAYIFSSAKRITLHIQHADLLENVWPASHSDSVFDAAV